MTRDQLLAFMREHSLGVQVSVTERVRTAGGGSGIVVTDVCAPQAAVVGIVVTDRVEIFFDTVRGSRKAENLRRHPRIAFVIGGWVAGDERTVQYEGIADEPAGAELERLKRLYFVQFPEGREREAWPDILYVRARPEWVRYGDYNRTPPEIVEFTREQLGT